MIRASSFRAVVSTTVAFGALCAGAGVANADGFSQTNLVSDMPGLATVTDPNLKNPWGLSFANGSPIWISNQGTQTATLYPVTGSTGVSATPFTVTSRPREPQARPGRSPTQIPRPSTSGTGGMAPPLSSSSPT
jgi:hypothetical protein